MCWGVQVAYGGACMAQAVVQQRDARRDSHTSVTSWCSVPISFCCCALMPCSVATSSSSCMMCRSFRALLRCALCIPKRGALRSPQPLCSMCANTRQPLLSSPVDLASGGNQAVLHARHLTVGDQPLCAPRVDGGQLLLCHAGGEAAGAAARRQAAGARLLRARAAHGGRRCRQGPPARVPGGWASPAGAALVAAAGRALQAVPGAKGGPAGAEGRRRWAPARCGTTAALMECGPKYDCDMHGFVNLLSLEA